MLVEELMSKKVITLKATNTIEEAVKELRKHRIRLIPIVDDNNGVLGMVSSRNVRDASPSIFDETTTNDDWQKPLSAIMAPTLVAHPLDFVEDAAAMFYEHHLPGVPVVSEGVLVGILTDTDLLRLYIKMTGVDQPGSQLIVRVPDQLGTLSTVSSILTEHNVNILSVFLYPDQDNIHRLLRFRIQTINPIATINHLKEAGYEVVWPHFPELTP